MKKILIFTILIVCIIFTSLIKNKTRLLEKELVKLNKEIKILNINLNEATLDFEYLATPKNVSFLAKNFLDDDFSHYDKIQIDVLNDLKIIPSDNKVTLSQKNINHKEMKSPEKDKVSLGETENNDGFNELILGKLPEKDSYGPTKADSKKIYKKEEKNIIESKQVQKWAGLQVIKALLGIPIIPGSN